MSEEHDLSTLFPVDHEHVARALETADPNRETWITGRDDEGSPWAASGMGSVTALIHCPDDWVIHVEHHGAESEPSVATISNASALSETVRELTE